jgi:hypothetical protein
MYLQRFALAGGEFWEPKDQLVHFIGPDILYDVSQSNQVFKNYLRLLLLLPNYQTTILFLVCQTEVFIKYFQIFVPTHLVNHYVLYVFDMEHKKISILDSLNGLGPCNETRSTRHNKTCFTIAMALTECLRLAFPGWDEDITQWGFEVVNNIPQQLNT